MPAPQLENRAARFAYADPPYPGQAAKHYADHADYAGEVDHAELIARLVAEYPDGWALSTSASALAEVLPLCPRPDASTKRAGSNVQHTGVRVMAWCKPFAGIKPKVSVQYAWEPVIVAGGRRRPLERGVIYDYVRANPVRPTDDFDHAGAKPRDFCFWLFEVLGALPGDHLDDLFPGSGGVRDAWRSYTAQQTRLFHPRLVNAPFPDLELDHA